jgi:predicted tellurium resistance membrane protein TerC
MLTLAAALGIAADSTVGGPLFTTANLVAVLSLTALEIVLGIDNIVFIAILAGKLPVGQRDRARVLGLTLALMSRILLLLTVVWIMGLARSVAFHIPLVDHDATWKDAILIAGGLFLVYKATTEIHHKIEGAGEDLTHPGRAPGDLAATAAAPARRTSLPTMGSVLWQILLIDVVFSIDSVITAVGMARAVPVMVAAVMISVGVMLVFSGRICRFIERHPTMKMLALAFLLLIGVALVAEGLGRHIEKGYIYFAMAFSLAVECLNLASTRRRRARAAS